MVNKHEVMQDISETCQSTQEENQPSKIVIEHYFEDENFDASPLFNDNKITNVQNQLILKGATKGGVGKSDYKDSQNSTENNTPFNVFTSGSDMPSNQKPKLIDNFTKKGEDSDSSPVFLPTSNAETPDKDKNFEPIAITRMKPLMTRRPSSTQNRSNLRQNEEEDILALPSPGLKQRAVSPMGLSLSVSNNISSLIRGKAPSGNSRLNKLGASLNLSSRVELIEQNKQEVMQLFEESQQNNFDQKYFYHLEDKLGEGAHASVYKCYLNQDREKVEQYYAKLKELGLHKQKSTDSFDIFERAEDSGKLHRIDEDPDEQTPCTSGRERLISGDSDEIRPSRLVPTLDPSVIPYAVKIVRDNDPEKLRAHENEFIILSKLKHKNITRAVEMFKDQFKNEVYQVMQFIEGKEICDAIASMGKYDEVDAQHIYKQILKGLEYMHQERICHRDIKPSNILITKDKQVFIADFNVAKHVPKQGLDFTATYEKRPSLLFVTEEQKPLTLPKSMLKMQSEKPKTDSIQPLKRESEFGSSTSRESTVSNNFLMHTRTAGTLAFAAPERIKDNCSYTEKVDLWSAGIVLFMLLTGEHPFDSMTIQNTATTADLFDQIMGMEEHVKKVMKENSFLSAQAKDLVCKLIRTDPAERLSATQALREPWMQQGITRESCSLLNTAQSSLKQRMARKSMGLTQEFERMPLQMLRLNELLKSGIDMKQKQPMKRSISMCDDPKFFSSISKLNSVACGSVRKWSHVPQSLQAQNNTSDKKESGGAESDTPFSPQAFDNSSFADLSMRDSGAKRNEPTVEDVDKNQFQHLEEAFASFGERKMNEIAPRNSEVIAKGKKVKINVGAYLQSQKQSPQQKAALNLQDLFSKKGNLTPDSEEVDPYKGDSSSKSSGSRGSRGGFVAFPSRVQSQQYESIPQPEYANKVAEYVAEKKRKKKMQVQSADQVLEELELEEDLTPDEERKSSFDSSSNEEEQEAEAQKTLLLFKQLQDK